MLVRKGAYTHTIEHVYRMPFTDMTTINFGNIAKVMEYTGDIWFSIKRHISSDLKRMCSMNKKIK